MGSKIEQMPNGLIVKYYFNFSHLNLFDNLIMQVCKSTILTTFNFQHFNKPYEKHTALSFGVLIESYFKKPRDL